MAVGAKKTFSVFGVVEGVKSSQYPGKNKMTGFPEMKVSRELQASYKVDGLCVYFEGKAQPDNYNPGVKGIAYEKIDSSLVGQTVVIVVESSDFGNSITRVVPAGVSKAAV